MKTTFALICTVLLLCACGDKAQTASSGSQDAAPYKGTGKPMADPAWKQGDKASWESHLKARGENTQNEYSRTN